MELVSIARALWRRRIVVGVGVLLTALVGLAAGGRLPGHERSPTVGVATGAGLLRVLVDRPRSLVADATPEGSDTNQIRAHVVADLMSAPASARSIAEAAGIPAAQLLVKGPHVGAVAVGSPLSTAAAAVAVGQAAPYMLGINVAVAAPIITIDTWTPDPASARRLAEATVGAMQKLVATSEAEGPGAVVIRPLGTAQSISIPGQGGAHGKRVVAAAALFLALWCFGILAAEGLGRAWRGPLPSS